MRRSKTLAKLRDNQLVRICGLGHYIPEFIQHASHFGFDCIWVDLEHRTMDDREIQAMLAFFHMFDIDCMLRPPTLEKSKLYRYLEDGATGLLIPHVSTPEKARQLVQAVKFPPLGDRGMDGAGLDVAYLPSDPVDYAKQANQETFLFVQIETIEALDNVDSIAAVEGVDGIFIGPTDLSLRLKQVEGHAPTLDEARTQVAVACRKHGKPWGQPAGTVEILRELFEMGGRLLAHGGDFFAIYEHLNKHVENFKSVSGDS